MPDITANDVLQGMWWQRSIALTRATACALIYTLACTLVLMACDPQDPTMQEQADSYADYLRVRSKELDSIERASVIYFSEHKIPAAVTAIVNRGDMIHLIEHGVDDFEHKNLVRGNTVFQIAALSRVFTAVIAQNLIQDGTLDPSAFVVSYFPSTLTEEATQRLAGITLADLLHHQSGFPVDELHQNGNAPGSKQDPLTEAGLWQFLESVELVSTPGEQYLDTAWDYTVLAYLLELASGSSYRALLHKFVTGPFGLSDTGVEPSRSGNLRMATAYQQADRARAIELQKPGRRIAAMGLYSTARDVARLMILQMKAYQRFSRDNLVSPLLITSDPATIDANKREGYGLSISLVDYEGHSYEVFARNGEAFGFASSYLFIPGLDVGVVTLASSGGAWISEQQEMIVGKLLGKELPVPESAEGDPINK